ncbi:MAG TPA: glycosyltransferase, partial [Candidatus Dormibacteraeota bacterium]|nr:glycosyltransferase [Candidatus Dormibacteraeota bacterium]
VICSRVQGQVDVVDEGRTGLIVPAGDPIALREAIRYLWDNPAVAEEMGRQGRIRVEHNHTLEGFIDAVRATTEEVAPQPVLAMGSSNR